MFADCAVFDPSSFDFPVSQAEHMQLGSPWASSLYLSCSVFRDILILQCHEATTQLGYNRVNCSPSNTPLCICTVSIVSICCVGMTRKTMTE